jgi:phospho-N-acetylmuramoyl-pentapeptide-transferase
MDAKGHGRRISDTEGLLVLHWLIQANLESIENSPLSFLRLLAFPEFQALLATLLTFLGVLALGRPTIGWLVRKRIGDNPDFDDADFNEMMKDKRNTPTMGGLLIVLAIAGITLLFADIRNFYVQMGLVCLLWLGAVGAVDDWLKLTSMRRQSGRQGLHGKEKLAFQIGLALLLGYFVYRHGSRLDAATGLYLPFVKGFRVDLPLWAFLVVAVATIVGSSNAVNLTDGLDGLAAGCMAIVGVAFLALTLIISDERLSAYLLFHHIRQVGQLGVLCGGIVGASLGFLWFNAHPAKVFMGDTGSLALGGLIGFIALVIRQELMLFLIGGVFVAEAVSVMLQVGWFKWTKRRTGTGRRIFLMAPLHHHFQKKGWSETQVVVRFWLIGAMLAVLALATVKLR